MLVWQFNTPSVLGSNPGMSNWLGIFSSNTNKLLHAGIRTQHQSLVESRCYRDFWFLVHKPSVRNFKIAWSLSVGKNTKNHAWFYFAIEHSYTNIFLTNRVSWVRIQTAPTVCQKNALLNSPTPCFSSKYVDCHLFPTQRVDHLPRIKWCTVGGTLPHSLFLHMSRVMDAKNPLFNFFEILSVLKCVVFCSYASGRRRRRF